MLTSLSNVLPLHLKPTFPAIILILTESEGDMIESRLPFKIFSTLLPLSAQRTGVINFSVLSLKIKNLPSNLAALDIGCCLTLTCNLPAVAGFRANLPFSCKIAAFLFLIAEFLLK